MTKKYLLIIFALSVLMMPLSKASAHIIITMGDDGFTPKDITIDKGETVIFQNVGQNKHWPASNNHPTHTIYPGSGIEKCGTAQQDGIFDACRGLATGETFSFTFDKVGIWQFHDHLYPQFGGSITVTDTEDSDSTSSSLKNSGSYSWRQSIVAFFSKIWDFLTHLGKPKSNLPPEAEKELLKYHEVPVSENSKEIFTDYNALFSYEKKYGAEKTILALNALEVSGMGSCHQPAHQAGHFAYLLWQGKAFKEISGAMAYCQSGYYHGIMEEYFKYNGTANLAAELGDLCDSNQNDFFDHQCIHGIGHGIMAWTNYDLPAALKYCDLLPRKQSSCYSGVFMENTIAKPLDQNQTSSPVGSTDIHYSMYLNDDPQYPCNAVDQKYVSSCYFYQPSRMVQIFGRDFKKVAEECAKAPGDFNQLNCFESMGREIGGAYPDDMAKEIEACDLVSNEKNRIPCLSGAVQNSFWDPSGQDKALLFCKLLKDSSEKKDCYGTIFERAPQIILNKTDLVSFCQKAEPDFQSTCKGYSNKP